MQDPKTMDNALLLKTLRDKEAEIDARDWLGRQSPGIRILSEDIHSLRTELLSRMGNNKSSEELLEQLIKISVATVNSGEDRSPEDRKTIERLTAEVLMNL